MFSYAAAIPQQCSSGTLVAAAVPLLSSNSALVAAAVHLLCSSGALVETILVPRLQQQWFGFTTPIMAATDNQKKEIERDRETERNRKRQKDRQTER